MEHLFDASETSSSIRSTVGKETMLDSNVMAAEIRSLLTPADEYVMNDVFSVRLDSAFVEEEEEWR